jgi:alpha-D-ribose 1-methylphosphonate 5-triphosphate synthase subunit PhnG
MKTATIDDRARDELAARQAVMRICAAAPAQDLATLASALSAGLAVADLRSVEKGLAMLRGRIGGEGAPFNLGEATVVRAAIQLGGSAQGFAYHLGRDGAKARNAAILDALWQREESRAAVVAGLEPIASRLRDQAALEADRTAATRVNFFTMQRGDD